MSDTRIPSCLRNAPQSPLTRDELDQMRAKAWRECGLIVIYPNEIENDFIRQGLVNGHEKRFGKRR